jgi:hydroxyacylglutathione hydrolase
MEPHPLQLEPIPALADNYIWLAADDDGNAIAVDPGEAAPVEAALAERGWTLRAILLTHHHNDHIGGVQALAAGRDIAIVAPVDPRIPLASRRVVDGERVDIALPALTLDVLSVPGHTSTHIAFAGAGLLFCGDTLFSLGCGRLFEGTPAQMLASLDRMAALPDDTLVCCAHEYTEANARFARTVEPDNEALAKRTREIASLRAAGQPSVPSTMAEERAANPFLRVDAADVVAWTARHGVDDTRETRFATLRSAKDAYRG